MNTTRSATRQPWRSCRRRRRPNRRARHPAATAVAAAAEPPPSPPPPSHRRAAAEPPPSPPPSRRRAAAVAATFNTCRPEGTVLRHRKWGGGVLLNGGKYVHLRGRRSRAPAVGGVADVLGGAEQLGPHRARGGAVPRPGQLQDVQARHKHYADRWVTPTEASAHGDFPTTPSSSFTTRTTSSAGLASTGPAPARGDWRATSRATRTPSAPPSCSSTTATTPT